MFSRYGRVPGLWLALKLEGLYGHRVWDVRYGRRSHFDPMMTLEDGPAITLLFKIQPQGTMNIGTKFN